MNRWYEYVIQTAGTEKQTHIEAATGIKQSTISKWKSGGLPTPAQAAKLAIAYGDNPVAAFVACGWVSWEEAGLPPRGRPVVEHLSSHELVAEIRYRMREEYEDGRPTAAEITEAAKMSEGASTPTPEGFALAAHDEDFSIEEEQEADDYA